MARINGDPMRDSNGIRRHVDADHNPFAVGDIVTDGDEIYLVLELAPATSCDAPLVLQCLMTGYIGRLDSIKVAQVSEVTI